MRTYEVRTYGCQMNVHDSERLSGLLEDAGYVAASTGQQADVVVFNTCAVRENADNKLYGNLGHLKPIKDAHPGMQIAVGGCMAQKDRGEIDIASRFQQSSQALGVVDVHLAAVGAHVIGAWPIGGGRRRVSNRCRHGTDKGTSLGKHWLAGERLDAVQPLGWPAQTSRSRRRNPAAASRLRVRSDRSAAEELLHQSTRLGRRAGALVGLGNAGHDLLDVLAAAGPGRLAAAAALHSATHRVWVSSRGRGSARVPSGTCRRE